MSQSANSPNGPALDVVLVGIPDSRRVELFQQAMARLELSPARLVSYADLLAGRAALGDALRPGTLVRVESPGKDFAVERALLALGADAEDEDDPSGTAFARLSAGEVAALAFEKGRILPARQWYLGYRALLRRLAGELGDARVMNPPADIATMFDKPACHARLAEGGVAVPPALGPVRSYAELRAAMKRRNWPRVFLKLAHGSSASGVVAYRVGGGQAQQQAITTVEMAREGGEPRLYNSRRIQTYEDAGEIAALVDALCRERVHVEQWLPKASHSGRTFDLRVVMIGGRVRHTVARLSVTPITNLHLLNARGDTDTILARVGAERWARAREDCERASGLFTSLYAGVDLLFSTGFKRHAILEMNAFGDLLPGVASDGEDTYSAEIRAALAAPGEPEGAA